MIDAELARLVDEELGPRGVPFVEATVVRSQRPSSVRAGDAAIVRADGVIEGFVGGACAEASVRLHALRVLETGEPLLLRILPGEAKGDEATDEGAVMVKNPCLSGGGLEIFLEPHLPPATLRIAGQGPIAVALADLGRRLGFAVEQAAAEETEPVAGDDAIVVASHGHEEERILAAALRDGVPYVGLVASRVRGDAVRAALELPEQLRAQLRTPAGLEIGARTPAEIALAILAEIVAARGSYAATGSRPITLTGSRHASRGQGSAPPVAPAAPSVAIDPVCGMEVAVSEASIQLEGDGERHYFCSEACRQTFTSRGASGAGVH